jgi:Holliday junction resolvasome RuvABC endonuclease subunit
MIVVGVDPGTANPGAALLRSNQSARWRVELVELPILKSLDDLLAWLEIVGDSCNSGTERRVVAIESVAWSLGVKEQGHGSGRILESVGAAKMLAKMIGAQVVEVAPITWRKCVTGNGRSTKEQARAVMARNLLGWPNGVVGLNRSDAVAIAIAGAMCAAKSALL